MVQMINNIIQMMKWIDGRNLKYLIGILACIVFIVIMYHILEPMIQRRRYLRSRLCKIDQMSGKEFENFLKYQLEARGYDVKLTQYTVDYGADLICQKDKVRIVIQAKRYKQKVGIKAIQEIVASKAYYHASESMVITNSYFTKNATVLAKANNTILWDRNNIIKEFDLFD